MKSNKLQITELDTIDAPGDGAFLWGAGAGLYVGAWVWVLAC